MKCLKNENQNLVEIIRNFDSRTCYESIQRYRSGGYLIFKDGGKPKIHIKKKNRGKFTDYCGGKVTDSCIRRAKASGNPTLVKRATFAANARKWKHQDGGTLDTNAKRINSTHSQIRMPNGTMKTIPSEIPLAPDGDSWILGLSGGAKGAGIMQELWNYFKWKQVNKPKMVGPFNLTKPVSYSKVSNYPKPLYIKIADMIAPF